MALLLLPVWWALVPAARGVPWAHWSSILAERTVTPGAAVIRQHVCSRPKLYNNIQSTWGRDRAAAWFGCTGIGKEEAECFCWPQFDGLGHFLFQHFSHVRLPIVCVPEVWFKTVYLRHVQWGSALKSSDLYCHIREHLSWEKNNTPHNISELLQCYDCNVIPPLGEWFQIEGKFPINDSRVGEWKRRYWAFHDQNPEEDCHPPHKVKQTTLLVSIHVRLGDVLVEAGKNDSQWEKHNESVQRLGIAKQAFSNALELASGLSRQIRPACGLHVHVVSDTPPGTVAAVMGLELDSSRTITYRNVTHTTAFTKQGLELDFVGVANPVLTIHCLAKSHILMTDGKSFFGRLAALLAKGFAFNVGDVRRNKGFSRALRQFRTTVGGPVAQCIP